MGFHQNNEVLLSNQFYSTINETGDKRELILSCYYELKRFIILCIHGNCYIDIQFLKGIYNTQGHLSNQLKCFGLGNIYFYRKKFCFFIRTLNV